VRRKLFAGLGSGLVAGIVIALVLLNVGAPAAQPQPSELGASMGVKLVIEIHRADGTTEKYVKEGDLILENFAKTLVTMFSGKNDPDNEDKKTEVSGTTIEDVSIGTGMFGCSGAIRLGNGSITSPSLTDYKLANEIVKFCVEDADITVNGNNMTVDVFGSYTFDAAATITEVGLSYYDYSSTSDPALLLGDGYNVLVFHDVLSSPINVNSGDGITVHYYIYLINPS